MNQNTLKQLKKYRVAAWLLAALMVLIFLGGSFYLYDYTEHDPTFCQNCHIMKPAFEAWEGSIHQGIECHDCHYATILERNQMLLRTLFKRPVKVRDRPHEEIIVPSTMCIQCHWEGREEIPKISRSTGHALHWFKGAIECAACHAVKLHQFAPEQKLCLNCHPEGKALLNKMRDLACTDCHNFRRGDLRPTAEICLSCHAQPDAPSLADRSPAHRQFDCMTCHQTHDPEFYAKDACRNCHSLTMKRGQHPLHLEVLEKDCLACHKPHKWRISEKEAGELCSQCHVPYPLKQFG